METAQAHGWFDRAVFSLMRHAADVIHQLRAKLPDLPARLTPEDVFLALRELRNKW